MNSFAVDHSPKTVAMFCGLGLAVSLLLLTFGVDLSASWV
jgi:hypothetical protein